MVAVKTRAVRSLDYFNTVRMRVWWGFGVSVRNKVLLEYLG
jgi:hypothetical protein